MSPQTAHSAIALEAFFIMSELFSKEEDSGDRSMLSMVSTHYPAAEKAADERQTQEVSNLQASGDVKRQCQEKGKGQDSTACVGSSVAEGDAPLLRL